MVSLCTVNIPVSSGLLFVTFSTICIILFVYLVPCLLLISLSKIQSCWVSGLVFIVGFKLLVQYPTNGRCSINVW